MAMKAETILSRLVPTSEAKELKAYTDKDIARLLTATGYKEKAKDFIHFVYKGYDTKARTHHFGVGVRDDGADLFLASRVLVFLGLNGIEAEWLDKTEYESDEPLKVIEYINTKMKAVK